MRLGDKLLDVDGSLAFKRNGLELLGIKLDVLSLGDLIAFYDVARLDFVARLGVDLAVSDPMPGFLVELMEADLLAFGSRGIESDRTRDQRELEIAFPIGTRGHDGTPTQPAQRRICALRGRSQLGTNDVLLSFCVAAWTPSKVRQCAGVSRIG
jgi:hypothetical protein